jgi:hypothetical protein
MCVNNIGFEDTQGTMQPEQGGNGFSYAAILIDMYVFDPMLRQEFPEIICRTADVNLVASLRLDARQIDNGVNVPGTVISVFQNVKDHHWGNAFGNAALAESM